MWNTWNYRLCDTLRNHYKKDKLKEAIRRIRLRKSSGYGDAVSILL